LSIEQELIGYLEAVMPAGPHKARNINIVRYFYGFDAAAWPTLEETAEIFGVGTRERVRQIINEALRRRADAGKLPALKEALRLLRSRSFWAAGELASRIAQRTGDAPRLHLRGLLNLMHDLGMAESYEAYDPRLERLTRGQLASGVDYALVREDAVTDLQFALHGARRQSCRYGLANTARLTGQLGAAPQVAAVTALLRMDRGCWTAPDGDGFWYAVESQDNVLVAMAAKVFALTDEADLSRLSGTLWNALHARAGRQPHGGVLEVEAWIRGSRYFRVEEGRVRFLGKAGELTPVERELAGFLASHDGADYAAIKAHLSARGVLASAIPKAATQSPIVHIDRSGGLRAYRYSLVGRSRLGALAPAAEVDGSRPAPGAFI
jgi:hypothetical protein